MKGLSIARKRYSASRSVAELRISARKRAESVNLTVLAVAMASVSGLDGDLNLDLTLLKFTFERVLVNGIINFHGFRLQLTERLIRVLIEAKKSFPDR